MAAGTPRGFAPSAAGFLVIGTPALAPLFRRGDTRRFAGFPAGPKLVVAMLLMGGSFQLLLLGGAVGMFALVILVFVIGEMLWVPTSQAIAARLAPQDLRGAHMGAVGTAPGRGLAPRAV